MSIEIKPENPSIEESFHVTGFLTTAEGKPLGNKRVTLESSLIGPEDPDSFAFIAIKVTERSGYYDFFRPVDSPPEYLIVKFAGNDEYEPVTSSVIAVRGAGTDNPQVRSNLTGNIMVNTYPQGADISVDDIIRGITPQKIVGLTEGPHILQVAKSGYMNQTMEVYVTHKNDVSFEISLKQL